MFAKVIQHVDNSLFVPAPTLAHSSDHGNVCLTFQTHRSSSNAGLDQLQDVGNAGWELR